MLQNLILSYASRRNVFKLVAVLAGVGVLAFASVEKIAAVSVVLWTASPLVLLWLLDVGLAAGQRRYAEWMKENPEKEDPSVVLWDGGIADVFRFFRELISLSIWPFYLILFALIGFGGREITKANKEAAEAAQKAAAVVPAPPYYQQSNVPPFPNRSAVPFNPAMQRFTPSPFPTPPRFPTSVRPFATPPKVSMTPPSSPNSSPAPAMKNP